MQPRTTCSRLALLALLLAALLAPACGAPDYADLYIIAEYPEALYAFGVTPATAGNIAFMQMNITAADGEAFATARNLVQGFAYGIGPGEDPARFMLTPAVSLGTGGVVEGSVAARDILDMDAGSFMVAQVHIPVEYNFPEATLEAWREGLSYRVHIQGQDTPAGGVAPAPVEDAVRRALAQHYSAASDETPRTGSAWVLAIKPLVARTQDAGPDAGVNLFTDPDVRLASTAGGGRLDWQAEVLVCPGYTPSEGGRVAEPSAETPDRRDDYPRLVEGTTEPEEGVGVGIGFAFSPAGTPDLPFQVKAMAQRRAAAFLPWTTHGFHFDKDAGELAPNAVSAPELATIPTTPFRTAPDRSFYVARARAPLALDLPEFGVARIKAEVTYQWDPDQDERLENLPRLLAYQGVQRYGGNIGLGFLDRDLAWTYDRDEGHLLTVTGTVGLYMLPFEDD